MDRLAFLLSGIVLIKKYQDAYVLVVCTDGSHALIAVLIWLFFTEKILKIQGRFITNLVYGTHKWTLVEQIPSQDFVLLKTKM